MQSRLIKGSGGVFEVRAGETLIFSKKAERRFPTDEEVFSALDEVNIRSGS